MAKKSEYSKYRDKIKRYLKSMEQKGYTPTEDYSNIPTENQLRKSLKQFNEEHVKFPKEATKGYIPEKEQEEKRKQQIDRSVQRQTILLRQTVERLKKEQEFINIETGEILSPKAIKERAKLQKQLEKENEGRFWSNEPQIEADVDTVGAYVPDGGEIAFDNVISELMSKLTTPTSNYVEGSYGKQRFHRSNATVQRIEESKSALITLINNAVAEKGASAVGWALDEYDNLEADLDMLVYGYEDSAVNSAYMRIAEVIKGAPLSFEENASLSAESANEEWWEEPD